MVSYVKMYLFDHNFFVLTNYRAFNQLPFVHVMNGTLFLRQYDFKVGVALTGINFDRHAQINDRIVRAYN